MNGALPDMLQCNELTVLDRQTARMKWLQEQFPEQRYFSELSGVFSSQSSQGFPSGFVGGDSVLGEAMMTRQVKSDPGLENGWPDLRTIEMLDPGVAFCLPCGYGNGSNFEVKYTMSRTSGCPQSVAAVAAPTSVEVKERESIAADKTSVAAGKESFKKRKVEKLQNTKVVAEEGDSKITEQHTNKSSSNNNNKKKETSADTSKENSKVSDVQKADYIHVRARRGQATDSHSLAERLRREKISERMRGMLHTQSSFCTLQSFNYHYIYAAANFTIYAQSKQFLSMKLAAVNPRLDFNIDNLFAKEMFPACTASFPAVGMSSEMINPAYLQLNPVQQAVSCCGLEMGMNPSDMGLRRAISAAVSVPEAFIDPSCIPQIQPPAIWDAELQNPYSMAFEQGRSTSFPPQPLTGFIEANNQKMEI
ncbi:hypothetical protein SLEP1_g50191 [Rubroshorea leprosula]|uniref:Uncharacterized protein n=1 Tax=Rubroshorea leprosula TaxID=152421 RepID=A0AAV5LZG5_9ROSI|nr:hypothetical protein SLEP1_g50191 [Rubroshorea leprosula]